MKAEHHKYALAEVPRYTSYPTAVQFSDGISEADYRLWLAQIAPGEPLSLYVHIPFCQKMCWYCGCHTTVAHTYDRVGTYAQDMLAEIDLLAAALPEHHGGLAHVHFGGGSPTMLTDTDFAAITAKILSAFGPRADMELAIEIDPRTMSAQKACALAKAGVTRASLGVQDFNPHVQEKINRIQPFELVRDTVDWLREAGVQAINFDLIYGLPGQSVKDVKHSTELAISLRPDRLAVFGYAHVPWFKKHQEMIKQEDLPGMEERFAEASMVGQVLEGAGYVAVGFDHYAHPDDSMAKAVMAGTLRRNFQGYTTDTADTMLGLGASSIGALGPGYVQNAPALDQWRKAIHAGKLPITRGVALAGEDAMRRAAIMTVMSTMALDLNAHTAAFGAADGALDDALEKLMPLAVDGLVNIDGHKITVTPQGRVFVRNIGASFDTHWQMSAGRHSRAV
ncbi:MAG: oxygen-independent coproporphyrinogen III oxidase [Robiginitomaculum sp.]|nr:MAG: oxygen-independent coproporphyrinogen III oxidase [Robiginitomaculum sp.]